ncbi:MAG TPA: UPF0182 family protein [Streptosporangiaceae bacterium]|nr:UPF0182 family protein [Streptosporangiaceae bacterium]
MTFRSPGRSRPVRLPHRPRYLIPVLAAIIAVIVVFIVFANVWTDFLWFSAVNYGSVFTKMITVRLVLFVIGGALMSSVVGANVYLAYRFRPTYRALSPEQQGLERYRSGIDPYRKLIMGFGLGLLALVSGLSAAGAWRTWLLFVNQTSFGLADPQFHLDISFFTFTYPFIRFVLGFTFTLVVLSVIAAAATHYLYGGLRLQGPGDRSSVAARAQVFVLLGIFVLLKAVSYWYDRYGLNFSQRGTVTTGASYTDVNAVLPAKTILAVIAIVCALLFFAGALRRSVMLPAVGFGLLVLSAILVGGVYPAIIQQFDVKPNELAKESPYIQREIAATRQAYGISGVQEAPYAASPNQPAAQLAAEASSLPGVRQIDPAVVSPAFQQLQQIKGYYKFASVLDMDRYPLPGAAAPQDTVVAVREMPGPPASQSNWVTQHLVYTHGYGFVAASANTVGSGGDPSFIESNIPFTGELPEFQPRIYFGPLETNYVIVGAPPGRAPQELDFPNQSTSGQQNTTYQGGGGVAVGSFWNRLLYATKLRQLNILLSGAVNHQSRILYVRDPLSRVAKVAPFLTLDGAVYPVISGGKLDWVADAYTTTNLYPYSERVSLGGATADSIGTQPPVEQSADQINYIRNSVKAVVDAYTGKVTLYEWSADPVLRTWMKAFPGVIKPKSAIPADLLPHLRYPQDLLKVQRPILARYHVQQAQAFYGGQDFWAVPSDPTTPQGGTQPPYYLTMSMPGYTTPQFSLATSFVAKGRENVAAVMAVDSNPVSPDYGTIRILELPRSTVIAGPNQVQNTFESYPTASRELALYRQGGSTVITGNLIVLPVGGGLLYIEPVYLQATGGAGAGSYPTVQRVFVSFNGAIGYGATLQAALSQVFSGLPSQPASPSAPSVPSVNGQLSAAVRGFLAQAESHYQAAQQALKRGDFATYGQQLQLMKQALDQANSAAQQTVKPSPAPTR